MSAAVAAARKRPAPYQEPRAVDPKKRPRHYAFGSTDDYELLEVIGEGAYGLVRRARDRRTGDQVALKWIRGEGPDGHGQPDSRKLTMEAGCLTACRGHPSIVEIKDVAADPETEDMHLVTEFVNGSSLRETIWRPLSEDVVRAMMRQLVGAAKKIHDVGFIHRDIKPENVIVSPSGALKVCDFGTATRQKPAGRPHEGWRVGTLQCNSPEQLAGSCFYGPAVDMWALGCVMAELLSGDCLFLAETEKDMIAETSELRDRMSSSGIAALECSEELSEAGREVLAGLLAFCPEKRLTAAEAMEHWWFTKKAFTSSASALSHPWRQVLAGLLAFCSDERLTAAEALKHPWSAKKAEFSASAHPGFLTLFS